MPSATIPETQEDYAGGDVVVVTGDGLAVRQGPSTQYPLLAAARWSATGVEVLGSPYRLSAGEELIVGPGPLIVDGKAWYSVRHADDEIQWTPLDEPGSGIAGWIAANDGISEFVRLVEASSDERQFFATGVGPSETSEIPELPGCPGCGPGFVLTVGNSDPGSSCDLRVLDNTGAVLLDDTIVGWGSRGSSWPGEPGTKLQIETKCAWHLRVGNYVG
jgi:hypothetical protein